MAKSYNALDIPYELLQDDNHPQEIDFTRSHPSIRSFGATRDANCVTPESIPLSSAPQYTLYRLLRHLRPKSVLEIGTQSGASAVAMALAFRDNPIPVDITCVDPFFPTGDNDGLPTLIEWYNNLYSSGFKPGVQLLVATSSQVLPVLDKRFDFVFVDGSHRYENVKEDCLLSLLLLRVGGYFLVHDYVIYESVKRACDRVVAKYDLPHFVNSIQKNLRGELCGWMIARKVRDVEICKIQSQLKSEKGQDWNVWYTSAKRHIPSPVKRVLRKFVGLFR